MSFYSSLKFYHPGPPPKVTGDDLARFAAAVKATGLLEDKYLLPSQVKFGKAIDQDDREDSWEVEIAPGLFSFEEIEWDVELAPKAGIAEVISRLERESRGVYRASICFGLPSPEVREPIARRGSPENEVDLGPDSLSLRIGPVGLSDLQSGDGVHAGWISLNFSGPGYMYPWTLRDWVARAEGSPAIGRLTALCRETWPVEPAKPSRGAVKARRALKSLWPYDDLAKPGDWYWGVQETG